MRVLLGNPAPKEAYLDEDGGLRHRELDGARVTTIHIPDTYTPIEAFAVVTAQDGAWNHHTAGDLPSDTRPDWLECDDDTLRLLLESHFGCPVGRPKTWKGQG
jgi:hypothetical protein